MGFTVADLNSSTWDAFAELVERNNGIFGGCWCIGWHPECGQQAISHRQVKEDRVRTGRAHAPLVIDECGVGQGWCPYGSPEELSNIKHKRKYDQAARPVPDWRIACFYVDPKHRGQGIARAALGGALDQIAWRTPNPGVVAHNFAGYERARGVSRQEIDRCRCGGRRARPTLQPFLGVDLPMQRFGPETCETILFEPVPEHKRTASISISRLDPNRSFAVDIAIAITHAIERESGGE